MRRPYALFRLAAVCSSFLLVAGYVLYRSNAGVKTLPGSKSMTPTFPTMVGSVSRRISRSCHANFAAAAPAS